MDFHQHVLGKVRRPGWASGLSDCENGGALRRKKVRETPGFAVLCARESMRESSPLRILHIDTGLSLRGGQRQLLMLAEGLRDRGHEQFIACLEESALVSAVRKLQIQTFTLPPFDPWNAFGIMLLRQLVGAWRPQIIHAHDGRGQSIAWLASLGFPVKRIASRRVTFLPSAGWTYRLK